MRIALTDRFCAAAKAAGAAQADFFDEKTVGLCLRVSAAGRKTWCLVYTAPSNDKRVRIGLGLYPAVSLAEARGKALEARGHVEDGRDPRSVAMADGAMTVADLVAAYLAKYANGLRSGGAIARRLQKNVVPVIGGVRVADLHRRDITRVIDPILARDAPTEAARVFENFQSALRWGVRRGDLDRNPAEGMTKAAGRPPRERVLSDEEIRTLWQDIAKPLPRLTDQRVVKVCLVTAQRVGEVAGMRRDELDFAKRVWALPGSRVKNGTAHSVPLSGLALKLIGEALADAGDSPFVFPNGAGPRSPANIAHVVVDARKRGRSPIAHWTVHDLRRTALTGMAALGVAPIVLGAIANHLSITRSGVTLAVYARYSYAIEAREALDLWADRLAAIVAGDAAKVLSLRGA
jgi:integrase